MGSLTVESLEHTCLSLENLLLKITGSHPESIAKPLTQDITVFLLLHGFFYSIKGPVKGGQKGN